MGQIANARSESEALEQLHRQNMTDGLPVVIPTRARVDEMLMLAGLDGDVSLGDVGPSMAAATLDVVAANAIMAGCLPEHFPVVVAAVKAICDPRFDLTETQVTTHPVTPMLIVNGPARTECGIASGTGCWGPGFRANAAIGRTIRLVMMNVGGGRPGVSDMANQGSPAKYAYCAAENEEESPWEPLHVSRGFRADQSVVTALTVEGPHSVVVAPMPEDMVDQAADCAIRLIASQVGALGSNSTYFGTGDIAIMINPMVARMLADAGYDRPKLAQAIVKAQLHSRKVLRLHNPVLVAPGPDDDYPVQRDPSTLVIAVTGCVGGYVMVCPTLGVSEHGHPSISKEIELAQFCELPPGRP